VKLFLFDERQTDAWRPFALTRPIGELLFGTRLLRERIERFAGRPTSAALTRPWLQSFREPDAPPAWPRSRVVPDGERLFVSSRFVPADGQRFEGRGEKPVLLLTDDGVVGAYIPPGQPSPDSDWLEAPEGPPGGGEWLERHVEGAVLDAVWRLVDLNPDQLAADLAADPETAESVVPDGAHLLGTGER
jgi:hypothetical protein